MSDHKARSLTRQPVQLYPETKALFDRLHEELGSLNQSQTMDRLINFWRRHNEEVKV